MNLPLPNINNNKNKHRPIAALKYRLYDIDSVVIDSGEVAVTRAAADDGKPKRRLGKYKRRKHTPASNTRKHNTQSEETHEYLTLSQGIDDTGFIEVYLENTSEEAVKVYFDDYQITVMSAQEEEEDCSYRYAFNGMEKDDEVYGSEGTSYTTHFRNYDPRVGRWWSTDPEERKYAGWSPYVFSLNNPVNRIDPNGDDPPTLKEVIDRGKKSKTFVKLLMANDITDINYKSVIKVSDKSTTASISGRIKLRITDEETSVLSLTHELTNRGNLDKVDKALDDVRSGAITPDQFAETWISLELEGIVNKIMVAAELDIKTDNFTVNFYKKRLQDEKITEEALRSAVLNNNKNKVKIKSTGEFAIEAYRALGQKERDKQIAKEKGTASDEELKGKPVDQKNVDDRELE